MGGAPPRSWAAGSPTALTRLAALALLACGPVAMPAAEAAAPPLRVPEAPAEAALPEPGPATSLLVVAPHPDDETLCCAGAMQKVLAAGGHVAVVWVTSGDGSELDLLLVERSFLRSPAKLRDLAQRRMAEAHRAMARLGVPEKQLFFLGYPDRGILPLVTDYWSGTLRSPFTGATEVPYSEALSPGHAYTGANLEDDLAAVLERVRPTLVLAPAPADAHPDHRASGVLTLRVVGRHRPEAALRFWIVHGGEAWPLPRGLYPDLPQTIPPRGRRLGLRPLGLTPAEERAKREALACYRTQMEVMSSFLNAFVRTTELYSAHSVPPLTAPPGP